MNIHGEAKAYWEDDLLIVKPKGAFNLEGGFRLLKDMQAVIQKTGLPRWRRLEILDPETMGSPDVLDVVNGLFRWYDAHGCYAVAAVVTNGVQRYAFETVFEGNNVSIFENEDDAREWLETQKVPWNTQD